MKEVVIPVTYRFAEYRVFAREHIERARGSPPSRLGGILIDVAAWLAFAVKVRRIPRCEFRIDDAGIRRRTARGEVSFAWSEVLAIHRLTPGYLVELRKGAMPIPYRCIDPREAEALSEFLARKQADRVAASP